MVYKFKLQREIIMDASVIVFAINAGIKLGKATNSILVDSTKEAPLMLPLGDLYGSITEADAIFYFDAHPELVAEDGPYYAARDNKQKIVKAYKTIKKITDDLGDENEVHEILKGINKYEQFKEGYGAKPALQRFIGTIVEIGIDYALANPSAISNNQNTQQYITAFLDGLEDTDFSDDNWDLILTDFLTSALKVFNESASDIISDERASIILTGITTALHQDIKDLAIEDLYVREKFFKRVGHSILTGVLNAAIENPDIYLSHSTSQSKQLIDKTVTNVLTGLNGQEDLFSNDALKSILQSALLASAENAQLFIDNENKTVQKNLKTSIKPITDSSSIFSNATLAAILKNGLDTIRENASTLVDRSGGRAYIAEAINTVSTSLTTTWSSEKVTSLLSGKQLEKLLQIIFKEISDDPQFLLGNTELTNNKTILAQTITSIFKGLGEEPSNIASGSMLLDLFNSILQISLTNTDNFIDLNTESTSENLLYKVIHTTVQAMQESPDSRGLLTKKVKRKTLTAIIKTASSNIHIVKDPELKNLKTTIQKSIEVSSSETLKTRINGNNLPLLIQSILTEDESILNVDSEFKNVALTILRTL
jgi:hypothetical protein